MDNRIDDTRWEQRKWDEIQIMAMWWRTKPVGRQRRGNKKGLAD